MQWFNIFSDDWKPHLVPASFADALVDEMHERGFEGEIVRHSIVRCSLDQGGMCFAERPWEEFQFAGLDFAVPSEHVAHFHDRLAELPPRQFECRARGSSSRTYYKLHSYWNCVVLSPALRRQLLRSLQRRIDRAEARATAFYRDKRPLNEVLAEANERATGQKMPPELLGVDRHARFRKKARA